MIEAAVNYCEIVLLLLLPLSKEEERERQSSMAKKKRTKDTSTLQIGVKIALPRKKARPLTFLVSSRNQQKTTHCAKLIDN